MVSYQLHYTWHFEALDSSHHSSWNINGFHCTAFSQVSSYLPVRLSWSPLLVSIFPPDLLMSESSWVQPLYLISSLHTLASWGSHPVSDLKKHLSVGKPPMHFQVRHLGTPNLLNLSGIPSISGMLSIIDTFHTWAHDHSNLIRPQTINFVFLFLINTTSSSPGDPFGYNFKCTQSLNTYYHLQRCHAGHHHLSPRLPK